MKKLGNFSLIQQIDALIYSAGTIVFDSSDQESATRHFGEDKQLSSSLASRSQLQDILEKTNNCLRVVDASLINCKFKKEDTLVKSQFVNELETYVRRHLIASSRSRHWDWRRKIYYQ